MDAEKMVGTTFVTFNKGMHQELKVDLDLGDDAGAPSEALRKVGRG